LKAFEISAARTEATPKFFVIHFISCLEDRPLASDTACAL